MDVVEGVQREGQDVAAETYGGASSQQRHCQNGRTSVQDIAQVNIKHLTKGGQHGNTPSCRPTTYRNGYDTSEDWKEDQHHPFAARLNYGRPFSSSAADNKVGAFKNAFGIRRHPLEHRLGTRAASWAPPARRYGGGYGGGGRGRYRGRGWSRAGRGGRGFYRSRSYGAWGSTASLASDGMGLRRGGSGAGYPSSRRPRRFFGQGSRGRGYWRGGRSTGRGGWHPRGPPPTRAQLDAELDAYMADSKASLDKQLDAYMSEAAPK